jgi:hypothetical protein
MHGVYGLLRFDALIERAAHEASHDKRQRVNDADAHAAAGNGEAVGTVT